MHGAGWLTPTSELSVRAGPAILYASHRSGTSPSRQRCVRGGILKKAPSRLGYNVRASVDRQFGHEQHIQDRSVSIMPEPRHDLTESQGSAGVMHGPVLLRRLRACPACPKIAATTLQEGSMQANYDLVIRGGTVVDGTGRAPANADVGIVGNRIAAVGDVAGKGTEEIDAKGKLVTPGFVDIHTHYDAQAVWDSHLAHRPCTASPPQ